MKTSGSLAVGAKFPCSQARTDGPGGRSAIRAVLADGSGHRSCDGGAAGIRGPTSLLPESRIY